MTATPLAAAPPARRRVVLPPARPTVVAHRGSGIGTGPAGTRENSVAAFTWAVAQGVDWVELDVQAARDATLVLRHDVRDADGYVHAADGPDWAARQLARLEEVHAALPAHVGIDVEVKAGFPGPDGADAATTAALAFLARHADERPWLLTGFDPTLVLRAVVAGVPCGWLVEAGSSLHEAVVSAVRLGADVVLPHATSVLREDPAAPPADEALACARRFGMQVVTWGSTAEQVPRLRELGVDGVCVDDVVQTLAVLGPR